MTAMMCVAGYPPAAQPYPPPGGYPRELHLNTSSSLIHCRAVTAQCIDVVTLWCSCGVIAITMMYVLVDYK